jgi:hypothetical protein
VKASVGLPGAMGFILKAVVGFFVLVVATNSVVWQEDISLATMATPNGWSCSSHFPSGERSHTGQQLSHSQWRELGRGTPADKFSESLERGHPYVAAQRY